MKHFASALVSLRTNLSNPPRSSFTLVADARRGRMSGAVVRRVARLRIFLVVPAAGVSAAGMAAATRMAAAGVPIAMGRAVAWAWGVVSPARRGVTAVAVWRGVAAAGRGVTSARVGGWSARVTRSVGIRAVGARTVGVGT